MSREMASSCTTVPSLSAIGVTTTSHHFPHRRAVRQNPSNKARSPAMCACDCGACGRLVFTFPEIHPDPADQILGATQIEQFNAARIQIDDAAVEIEELDAITAPLDQVAPE